MPGRMFRDGKMFMVFISLIIFILRIDMIAVMELERKATIIATIQMVRICFYRLTMPSYQIIFTLLIESLADAHPLPDPYACVTAKMIKIQLETGSPLQMLELQIMSGGSNVALGA